MFSDGEIEDELDSESPWERDSAAPLTGDAAALLAGDDAAEAACAVSGSWSEEMRAYRVWHAAALAKLRAAAAAGGPGPSDELLPALSVYRFSPANSWIGFGDAVAGLSNVFLSAVRRRRVFILDWPDQRALVAPASGLETMGVNWRALAASSYGPNATWASWYVVEGRPTTDPAGGGPEMLWPDDEEEGSWEEDEEEDDEFDVDVMVHEHFNRGIWTEDGGASVRSEEDAKWIEKILPRGRDNMIQYGCVYRAAFSIARGLRAAAARRVPLPAPPARVLCAHIRAWRFDDPSVLESPHVKVPLKCLEREVRKFTDAEEDEDEDEEDEEDDEGNKKDENALNVFFTSDNLHVRDEARRKLQGLLHRGGGGAFFESAHVPQHIGYRERASPQDRENALATALQDWWLLSRCGSVITTLNTGFARTALAMSGAQPIFAEDENKCYPVKRDLPRVTGAGW